MPSHTHERKSEEKNEKNEKNVKIEDWKNVKEKFVCLSGANYGDFPSLKLFKTKLTVG